MDKDPTEFLFSEALVIFVLGGPGAGKGTQCTILKNKYHVQHLSIGDVLRAELEKPESEYAHIIRQNMSEGRIGPPQITISLLRAALAKDIDGEKPRIFFVDGLCSSMSFICDYFYVQFPIS
jgi:UMP-CMP kinase